MIQQDREAKEKECTCITTKKYEKKKKEIQRNTRTQIQIKKFNKQRKSQRGAEKTQRNIHTPKNNKDKIISGKNMQTHKQKNTTRSRYSEVKKNEMNLL